MNDKIADMTDVLKGLSHKYRQYVTQNVDLVGNIESVCKVLSYVVAGGVAKISISINLFLFNYNCVANTTYRQKQLRHELLFYLPEEPYLEFVSLSRVDKFLEHVTNQMDCKIKKCFT